MATNARFTLMAFPQRYDGTTTITLNIVFIPRNISPLLNVAVPFATTGALTPFADVKPEFNVMVVKNPNEFPGKISGNEKAVAPNGFTWSDDIEEFMKH